MCVPVVLRSFVGAVAALIILRAVMSSKAPCPRLAPTKSIRNLFHSVNPKTILPGLAKIHWHKYLWRLSDYNATVSIVRRIYTISNYTLFKCSLAPRLESSG